jgi:DNA-binding PadR family transcriptional regulator
MPARPIPVNATAAAILGLLHTGPMTGGELVAAAGEQFGGYFSVTRSQVYRELPALAEAGLLRLGKLGARASQQYRISAAGKRSFKAWLAGPGGADALRSPLVLRLRYAATLSADDRAQLVGGSRVAYAERLKAAQEAAGEAEDPYSRAVAEFTVAHLEAMLALLDAVPTAEQDTA